MVGLFWLIHPTICLLVSKVLEHMFLMEIILDFLPEIYKFLYDFRKKKQYNILFFIVLTLALFFCVYYNFYANVSIILVVLILGFLFFKWAVYGFKNYRITLKHYAPIKSICLLREYNERIIIKYKDIVQSRQIFLVEENKFVLNIFPARGGSYITLNGARIDTLELSPVFNYGTIFLQKILDGNGKLFFLKVRMGGFFKPYIIFSIQMVA